MLKIEKDLTLCLNGHSIKLEQAETNANTPVICWSEDKNATFTLTDCEPAGTAGTITHKSGKYGGGVNAYQAISDALNRQSIPYCREVPLWNKHKVKRLLENPRYTGKEGYPILVEADIFQAAQEKTAEKNARKQSHGEKPVIARLTPYFRCTCGGKMTRLGGGWQNSGKLYLRCEGCGNTAVMDMDATVNGIVRQFRDHEQPSCTAYTPSAEVMRLDNAINRGLEQPDSPEAVMALILQGAAARYACCPEPSAESEPSDSLTEADWRRFQRAVSHITISQDTEVTLIFTDKKATGKDE